MLLKVLSSLLPVLITRNFVANADSQGALRISPCRNQTIIQLQMYYTQENKKEKFMLKIDKVILNDIVCRMKMFLQMLDVDLSCSSKAESQ